MQRIGIWISLGESEEWGDEFIDLLKAEKAKGFPGGKEAFLRKAAQIPGTYCPALYDVEYTEQGDFKAITPRFEDVPATIQKRIIEDVEHVFSVVVRAVVDSVRPVCSIVLFVNERQNGY